MAEQITVEMIKKAAKMLNDAPVRSQPVVIINNELLTHGRKENIIYEEEGKEYYNDPVMGKVEVIECQQLYTEPTKPKTQKNDWFRKFEKRTHG